MDTLLQYRVFPDDGKFAGSRSPLLIYFPLCMDENETAEILAAAREQLRHTIERLDEARADLEAMVADLGVPEWGKDIDGPLAGLSELDAVVRCGLHDRLRPLIADLRSLLHGDGEEQP